MTVWRDYVEAIEARLAALDLAGCLDPFFRGQADASWPLLPGLSRERLNSKFNDSKEARLFWDFRMAGSHLLPGGASDWTVLYHMQHFGLPTRLLDWTTSFSHALFFALRSAKSADPAIYILNPYEMNSMNGGGDRSVSNLNVSFQRDYNSLLKAKDWPGGALAVTGDSSIDRLRHQKGSFTLHGDLSVDIEQRYTSAISKHVLPKNAIADAWKFLRLAGVDEFTIYSDLDGLARSICRSELGR